MAVDFGLLRGSAVRETEDSSRMRSGASVSERTVQTGVIVLLGHRGRRSALKHDVELDSLFALLSPRG